MNGSRWGLSSCDLGWSSLCAMRSSNVATHMELAESLACIGQASQQQFYNGTGSLVEWHPHTQPFQLHQVPYLHNGDSCSITTYKPLSLIKSWIKTAAQVQWTSKMTLIMALFVSSSHKFLPGKPHYSANQLLVMLQKHRRLMVSTSSLGGHF